MPERGELRGCRAPRPREAAAARGRTSSPARTSRTSACRARRGRPTARARAGCPGCAGAPCRSMRAPSSVRPPNTGSSGSSALAPATMRSSAPSLRSARELRRPPCAPRHRRSAAAAGGRRTSRSSAAAPPRSAARCLGSSRSGRDRADHGRAGTRPRSPRRRAPRARSPRPCSSVSLGDHERRDLGLGHGLARIDRLPSKSVKTAMPSCAFTVGERARHARGAARAARRPASTGRPCSPGPRRRRPRRRPPAGCPPPPRGGRRARPR